MAVFHAPAHCANHRERGDRALARLVEPVNALRACPVTGEDFEEMGRELRTVVKVGEDRRCTSQRLRQAQRDPETDRAHRADQLRPQAADDAHPRPGPRHRGLPAVAPPAAPDMPGALR